MPHADLVITDGVIYLPGGRTLRGWLSIRDGRVDGVGDGAAPRAAGLLQAGGRWVLPGLVDVHVHFRDPGFTEKEDFLTGSAAAAFGGVTTVIDMPNTEGLVITPDDVERKLGLLRGRSFVDYGLYALLKDSAPHVRGLKTLGIAGLKWLLGYGTSPEGESVRPSTNVALFESLRRAADEQVLVGVHAENYYWLSDFGAHSRTSGANDPLAPAHARPPFLEAMGVAEACIAVSEAGGRLHIHHISSAAGLAAAEAIREAFGTRLTIETCPQYLYLTEDDIARHGPMAICNPPIRRAEDRDALWNGIRSGRVDCIATDHAPHTRQDKTVDNVWDAKPGLLGVETTFPLLFHEVGAGRLNLRQFVELTSETPARIVGLGNRKGTLLPGWDADVLLVDPDRPTTIAAASLHSKHPMTPYEGMRRRGAITDVLVRGRHVIAEGRLLPTPQGAYAPSQYAEAAAAAG
jgi:allantoinase